MSIIMVANKKIPFIIYLSRETINVANKMYYYVTMTLFYQIRSWEQEKSKNGLHGKAVFGLVYTGFSCLDEAKTDFIYNHVCIVQLTTCLIVVLVSLQII